LLNGYEGYMKGVVFLSGGYASHVFFSPLI